MSSSEQANPNLAEAQQIQQNQQPSQEVDNQSLKGGNSTSSSEDLLRQEIKSLKKSIKSLKVENRVGLGLGALGLAGTIIAANWSTIAPVLQTVAQAIVVAAPISGIVIGSIAALGIALFCAYKIYEHRAKIKAGAEKVWKVGKDGAKYVAEKTVEGAKCTAGKIADGVVYSKDKVAEVYEYSADSLKRGASHAASATANKLYRMAGETNYLEEIKKFTPEQKEKSADIRKDIEAIFAYPENNSALVKSILSGIGSKIDSKIKVVEDDKKSHPNASEEVISGLNERIEKLKERKNFINRLDEGKLQKLLTRRSLPKDSYFIHSIFHENYDEIKGIIQECKKERSHVSTLERLNSAAKRSRSKSTPAQSTSSLPESGSFSSINTGSTDGSEAELLNPEQHKKVKQSSWFSWPRRGKAAEEAKETPIEVTVHGFL